MCFNVLLLVQDGTSNIYPNEKFALNKHINFMPQKWFK